MEHPRPWIPVFTGMTFGARRWHRGSGGGRRCMAAAFRTPILTPYQVRGRLFSIRGGRDFLESPTLSSYVGAGLAEQRQHFFAEQIH